MAHHEHHDLDADELDEELGPSKSQLKREARALVDLGETLAALPAQQLAAIPLPEHVRSAIAQARALGVGGSRKRQLKYVGKLLRQEDTAPIQAALDRLQGRHAQAVAEQHRLERWRDRLITEGDGALAELLDEAGHLDRQHLRQLIRNAQAEQAKGRPPKSARELFRYLRERLG